MKNENIEYLKEVREFVINFLDKNVIEIEQYCTFKKYKEVSIVKYIDEYLLLITIYDENADIDKVKEIFKEFNIIDACFLCAEGDTEFHKINIEFPLDVDFKLLNRKRKLKLLGNEE